MTRKDFELVAATLNAACPPVKVSAGGTKAHRWQWEYTVRLFAVKLGETNPRFDPDRFKRACGLEVK